MVARQLSNQECYKTNFLLSRIQRESIVIVKKFQLEILTNLHVLDLPESEKHNFGIMFVCEHDNSKTIRDTGMKFGDAYLTKNVDATGERSVRSLAHRNKVRHTSVTFTSETDGRLDLCLWRTLPVSTNDVYQARIVGGDGGSLPYCVRKCRVSDFVSMNQTIH
ncbi:hypothetical protein AVEN_130170-1 [Araneus ventricosus]|uniref:Uncharacterized protein n=1 Tax=Araneus ventricosus TaxID=182803 RepID=A0A4Y2SH07_ARAVE|nr:hypothetical protein AVEN_130170-1 [Araneus ventricosus]